MAKLVTLVAGAALLVAVATTPKFSFASQETDPIAARGRYLVEKVAACHECHSPRNERGEFDRAQWLHGAMLDYKPVKPTTAWADYAPALAGMGARGSAWTEEATIKLLETGLAPNGKPLRPPMPAYQMSHEDAAAVAAYFKSLPRPRVK